MGNAEIKPIKLKIFLAFLAKIGCEYSHTRGDHLIYKKSGLLRPIVVPCRDKELTPFFIKSNLKTLKLSNNKYLKILEEL